MSARYWTLGLVGALSGIVATTIIGCASKDGKRAGNGNINTISDDSNLPDSGAEPSSPEDDEPDTSDAGTRSASDAGSGCNPGAVDDPDDDFTDSNCDGIDGDKKKAVFVATTGSDTADGSWGKPVATLNHGIELATAQSKDVYVCAGDYKESITVNAQGIRVYGGYDCTQNWVRNSNSQAQLVSQTSPALVITGSKQPVVFDHVDVECASATTAGGSSIAAFISNSAQVTLRRGTYQAGDGASAQQPAAAAVTQTSTVVARQGNSAAKTRNCGVALNTIPTCDQLVTSSIFFALPTSTTWNAAQTPSQFTYCPSGDFSFGGGGGGTDPAKLLRKTMQALPVIPYPRAELSMVWTAVTQAQSPEQLLVSEHSIQAATKLRTKAPPVTRGPRVKAEPVGKAVVCIDPVTPATCAHSLSPYP